MANSTSAAALMIIYLMAISTITASNIASGLNDLDMETNERLPSFVTPGQTYRIVTGATVVLPCRVTEPGSYVLAWKRGIAILTAGPVKVSPDPRVRLLSTPQSGSLSAAPALPGLSGGGYSLELRDVRPHDAGDYVCQIGTLEPKEITHTLEILVPPRIHYVSHTGRLEVSQGATVKLECRASGNPVPTVSWTRKNNVLPSGERSVTGLTLLLQHVDRHSAGQYQCSADNGLGQPDIRYINLSVRYGPEVETERSTVHTGIGLEAQLVCLVHAEPAPHVVWYKESAQLGTTEQHATQTRGNRHTLIIRNVSKADYGNYSCLASNTLGKARGHLTLTGTATTAAFESPALGDSTHSYNISWVVSSHSAVTEFKLFFRPQPLGINTHRSMRQHDIDMNVVHRLDNDTTYIQGSYTGRTDWSSVILPGPLVYTANVPYPTVTKQRMSYVIRGLQPANHYEARVQAKNVEGWNKISPVFHFTTRGEDIEQMVEPSAQPAVYGVSNRETGMAAFNSAESRIAILSLVLPIINILHHL